MIRHLTSATIVIQLLRCVSTAAVPRQLTTFTDPNIDPFYSQESNVNDYIPGQVIRTRPIPVVSIPLYVQSATHLKYRSVDNQNHNVSNVATFFEAPKPVSPPVILSYQFAEDSLNIACAASYGFADIVSFPGDRPTIFASSEIISWALSLGYHVIVPDAEGPSSSWLVGRTEGQMVLDAIRAAIKFKKLNVGSTKIVMHGYSGAAHATEWAASLSSSYAPELNIIGSAVGGTPIDIGTAYNYINKGYVAGLAAGALFGLAIGHPELQNEFSAGIGNMTTAGNKTWFDMRAPGFCIPSKNLGYAFTDVNSYFNMPPTENPVMQAVMAQETLLMSGSSVGVGVPKFPRFVYHSYLDEVVPIGPVAQYVREQCQHGANILYKDVYTPEHVVTAELMTGDVMVFLKNAIEGTLSTCTCGTSQCS